MLAGVTGLFARSEINIKGFVVDSAGMQLLVTDVKRVKRTLDQIGFEYKTKEVHEVILEDRPGALAELCEDLADFGINIVSAFGVATGMAGRVYLDVSDAKRAAAILQTYQADPTTQSKRAHVGPITR